MSITSFWARNFPKILISLVLHMVSKADDTSMLVTTISVFVNHKNTTIFEFFLTKLLIYSILSSGN